MVDNPGLPATDLTGPAPLPPQAAPSRAGWIRLAARLVTRAALDPRTAADLLSLLWAYRARDWFRRPPFLPVPPADYLEWRMYTAYGHAGAVPPAEDILRFARWRRRILTL